MSDNNNSDNDKEISSVSENNDYKDKVVIEDEMKKSYLDYAMSVIVSRALPDIRDGLSLYTGEFCTVCMMVIMTQISLIENQQE